MQDIRNVDYGSEKYFVRNSSLRSRKLNIFARKKFKNSAVEAEFNVEGSC